MPYESPSGRKVLEHMKEGRDAFYQGAEARGVPYRDLERRSEWLAGWREAEQDFERGEANAVGGSAARRLAAG